MCRRGGGPDGTPSKEKGGCLAAAAQHFAMKGFFSDYKVKDDEPLKAATAMAWLEALQEVPKAS